MSGIKRALVAFGGLTENRWWWTFWAAFVGAQVVVGVDVPRWFLAPLLALYAFLAGWQWADWARKRNMRRRNAFIVEGPTRADVEAFIEELEWFVKQRKARHTQRDAAAELTRMRVEDGL